MTVDIVGIGKFRKRYPNYDDNKFESLTHYLNITRRLVASLTKRICPYLTKEMIGSDDIIANIAYLIMLSDWRWQEHNQKYDKYTYRMYNAAWAIRDYMKRKKKKEKVLSLNYNYYDDNSKSIAMLLMVKDKSAVEPIDELIYNEELKLLKQLLIQKNILNNNQRRFISYYYLKNMTLLEISKKYKISTAGANESIKCGLRKLREYY